MRKGLKTKFIGGAVLSAVLAFGTACSPLADTLKQKKPEHPSAELTDEKTVTVSSIRWMLSEKDNDSAIRAFDRLIKNPKFKPEMLNDEFIQKFVEVTGLVREVDFLWMDYLNLLENSKFMPEDILDLTKLVIEKPEAKKIHFALDSLIRIQKNPNFNSGMLDFIKLLIEKSEKANPTLYAFDEYLRNPNFKPEVLTEDFAEKLAEIVNIIVEKNDGEEIVFASSDIDYLGEILENPDFRPEVLDVVHLYVEKINDKNMLRILTDSLDNSNFEFGDESAERLAEIMNTIVNKNKILPELIKSNPEILDFVWHLAGEMDKKVGLDKIPQVSLLLDWILNKSDPSEICTMEFAENFTEAVIALIEKSDEIEYDTLGLLDAWTINPNFELKTLNGAFAQTLIDSIDLLVEIDELVEIEDTKNALSGLRSLLLNPNFKLEVLKILDEISIEYVMEETDSNSVSVLNGLLDNPDFSVGMYDKMDEVVQPGLSAEVRLNFAYAFSTIGKEKTMVLYEKCGIEYFGRYSKEMLEEAYDSLVPEYKKNRPLLVVVFNKNDWNGAFYASGLELDELKKYYKVMLFETDSEKKFYKILKKTAKDYNKIDTLVVGGHGEPGTINLGYYEWYDYSEKKVLDLTDKKELKKLKKYLADSPTMIIQGCSTGGGEKSIGELLSKVWNAKVWAPDQDAGLKSYNLDEEGKIESVTYSKDATKKFESGQLNK